MDDDDLQSGPSTSKPNKYNSDISHKSKNWRLERNRRAQESSFPGHINRQIHSQSLNREYNHPRRGLQIPNNQHNKRLPEHNRGRRNSRTNYHFKKQEDRRELFDFSTLQELANSDENDIIINLHSRKDTFFQFIGLPIYNNDVFVLVLQIISKVCRSSFHELKLRLLLDICNSQFIPNLLQFLMDLSLVEDKQRNKLYWKDPLEFWKNFIMFCECTINASPSTALKKCRSLIEAISKSCLEGLADRHGFTLPEEYSNKITELREKLTTFEMTFRVISTASQGGKLSHSIKPPDDFRQLSLQPTPTDFFDHKPFLRPNIVDGGYQDVEHYLDVQFRLMREDCFGPLREGILQYREDPSRYRYDNIRVHRNVRFIRPYVSETNFGSLIQIDISNRRNRNFNNVNWSNNKRFIYGSLVLFSEDNFQSFIVATILNRDVHDLSEGKIPVSLVSEVFDDDLYNPDKTYTMIESEVYYEPYYHVMKALQDPMFPENIAMQQYIVKVIPEVKPPAYLTPEVKFIYSNKRIYYDEKLYDEDDEDDEDDLNLDVLSLTLTPNDKANIKFNVLQKETWPSKEQLGFDESQYEAFHLALTNEFAVIQGPPGTGKTHLGINIANTLLHNLQRKKGCLMLVICYTNHALDQFLEAILKTTTSVVRIGGQSKNEAMTNINLKTLRDEEGHAFDLFFENKCIVKYALREFRTALIRFDVLNNGIIGSRCCRNEIREIEHLCKFYGSLKQDPLYYWLFQHKDLYRTSIENIILEYEDPNKETIEEIRERTEFILDDDDEEDTDLIKEQDLKASFSLNNSIATLKLLLNHYKTKQDPQDRCYLENQIRDLDSQIKLYNHMSVYRTRQTNITVTRQTNFTHIQPPDRWALYFLWVKEKINQVRKDIGNLQGSIKEKITAYEESRMLKDSNIIRSKKVVGMTTSGAARLRKMLQTLKPPIVIVEEAAEVLEQHIVTSLTKHCQHLILIDLGC